MDVLQAIFLLAIGFVMLVKGADWFVDGAAGIAEKLRVPSLIIGLTIVSFGTSAPELATSIISASQGSADIAVGNVIGSNITNILLILGLSAIISPLTVNKCTLKIDFYMLLGSSIIIVLFGAFDGTIGRMEGGAMILLYVIYIIFLIRYTMSERKKEATMSALNANASLSKPQEEELKTGFAGWYEKMKSHTWFLAIVMVVGLGLIVAGAMYGVIPGATAIAEKVGISEEVIGLTIVAIGTSLPELVTSVVAAKKGEVDIAVGNVVGSNIFNAICILGICGVVLPLHFQSTFIIDGLIAIAAAILLTVLGFLKGNKIRRWGGWVMLLGFIAYYVYLFAFA